MLETLLGIVTLVRLEQTENAPDPMPVTVMPLIALGINTEPPEPVYSLILSVPSVFVVKMNCACAKVVNVKAKNNRNRKPLI